MTTTPTPTECPCCGKLHDLTTGANTNDPPRPGDVTVCFGCGAICEFSEAMQLILILNTKGPSFAYARKVQRQVRQLQGLPVKESA